MKDSSSFSWGILIQGILKMVLNLMKYVEQRRSESSSLIFQNNAVQLAACSQESNQNQIK